jgi:nitrate/TMAO reductase-like tetraheme cytochrome c subunit
LVSAGVYQQATSKSASKISALEETIREREADLAEITQESEAASNVHMAATVNCLLCHELAQTKSFHLPQTIMKIDEKKGKRRRVCIDCHGPNAYGEENNFLGWSADGQMTPLSMISFNKDVGVNGVFEFSATIPHTIHKRVMYDLKVVTCDDCHLEGEEIFRPVADAGKGQVLVCQNCKYHPEDGNYIRIHVEDGGNGGGTCHTKGAIEIHEEKVSLLGMVG